ncbi:MAG: FtsK/SpoIIIE domain-containing protein [Ilumatobacteraceae bacterium]
MVDERQEFEIVVASGPDCGRTIPLTDRRQTLGRSPTCGIRIEDLALRPHHVMVSGRAPDLVLQALGGEVEDLDGAFRVGNTVCWVRPVIRRAVTETGTARPFHRPPSSPGVVALEPPVEPLSRPQPRPASAPPWGPVLGGASTGLIVAAVTRQWLFALFSVVTAAVAGVTWYVQRLGSRRARRRWVNETADDRREFDQRCVTFAGHLADVRRSRHRLLGDLLVAARRGDGVLWAKRHIDDVCIGYGSRQVVVVPGASPLNFNDIPVTVDLSAGSIIGVHGDRAESVVAALLLRLAMEVGPSDWQLLTAAVVPDPWMGLGRLAHCRRHPLTLDDLREPDDPTRHDIVWVSDPADASQRRSLALRYLEQRRASMIISAPSLRDLPAHCTTIIDSADVELDGVGPMAVNEVIEVLEQWQDPDAAVLAVPANAQFAGIDRYRTVSTEEIVRRWSTRSTTVRIDVGIGSEGPTTLDLVSDGPHAIVVGTTGAGKSELLRTLVMSLALNNSPQAVNLVLVDYKGGSAFDACADLPHVAAVVTDLESQGSENTARRMLRGLEAELRHRETLLRIAGVSTQVEYEHRCGSAAQAMPKLVIVIDELAALRADVPDVVSALVSVAQRGRSLGVHLIVATQRPGSELSGDIVANSSLRIALRLAAREDSIQVLGHPLAAALPRSRPGRAAMSIGGALPEVFQTLQVGDDLESLVTMTRHAAEEMCIPPPRRPWCEALPARLAPPADAPSLAVGMVDDPDAQRQFPLLWNPEAHLFVTGGPGSGKTWALHTLLAVLQRHDPSARFFVIAGRGGRSPWVAVQDHERLYRLLRHVSMVIDDRQRRRSDVSPLVLIIDDVDIWRSLYADDRLGAHLWDMFERIATRGPVVGVTCALSATRDHGLPGFVGSRLAQHWIGTDRSGSFRVPGSSEPLTARLFDPHFYATGLDAVTAGVDRSVTAVLPERVEARTLSRPGSFGIRADDLTEIGLSTSRRLRALVVGHRQSGRTGALHALKTSWARTNPDGRIIDLTRFGSDGTDDEVLDGDTTSVLLVVDDADRFEMSSNLLSRLIPALESPAGTHVSLLAAAPPHFLRARTDHWLQRLRMHRCGVLLGRCADEDGDLFGLYTRSLAVVPEARGRGLWIEDGESLGIVQFFDASSGDAFESDDAVEFVVGAN